MAATGFGRSQKAATFRPKQVATLLRNTHLSTAEVEERRATELEAQLAGVNAFLGEEDIPDDDDDGLDDLPMDDAVPRKKKKKKVLKGKAVKGKVVKKKVVKKKIVKKKKQV